MTALVDPHSIQYDGSKGWYVRGSQSHSSSSLYFILILHMQYPDKTCATGFVDAILHVKTKLIERPFGTISMLDVFIRANDIS